MILGRRRTAIEYALLLALSYAVPPILLPWLAAIGAPLAALVLLPLVTIPLAVPLLRAVRDFGEPRELNAALKGTARLSLWHSLAFAAGLALAGARLVEPAA